MPVISQVNARLLIEHIPKILSYIKESEPENVNYPLPLRTLSWRQIDFSNLNNKANLQEILHSVDVLMEAFYPIQNHVTLLMGDLRMLGGFILIRMCELELEHGPKRSHAELQDFVLCSLGLPEMLFHDASASFDAYLNDVSSKKYESLKSIPSYGDNIILCDQLKKDGLEVQHYFDMLGVEIEDRLDYKRQILCQYVQMMKESIPIKNGSDEKEAIERLTRFYYQNNHFQKKSFRKIILWLIIATLVLYYIFGS